jgi:Flp pilus assembly protein TadG
MLARLRKIKWERGSGELLGFAIALPLILIVFCAIIMAAQLGLARQALEYALYTAGRAAVVQNDFPSARNAAEMVAGTELYSGTFGISGFEIDIETVGGSYDASSGTVRWEKGALVKVVVTIYVDTIAPFSDSVLSSEITMMVERPVLSP